MGVTRAWTRREHGFNPRAFTRPLEQQRLGLEGRYLLSDCCADALLLGGKSQTFVQGIWTPNLERDHVVSLDDLARDTKAISGSARAGKEEPPANCAGGVFTYKFV